MEDKEIKFSESEAKVIFKQLLEAIIYLQRADVCICHRDINPNNIVLSKKQNSEDEYKLTLIDFNVAKRYYDPENNNPIALLTNTGTPNYKAPEVIFG